MKRSIIILLAVSVTAAAVWAIFSNPTARNTGSPTEQKEDAPTTQTKTAGPVTITATPQKINGADGLSFQIVLDTHSVELTDDLTQTVILTVGGKEYRPTAW